MFFTSAEMFLFSHFAVFSESEYQCQLGEETDYGPSIYTVTDQYIKPVTAAAGKMSWALMMHPSGLDCHLLLDCTGVGSCLHCEKARLKEVLVLSLTARFSIFDFHNILWRVIYTRIAFRGL